MAFSSKQKLGALIFGASMLGEFLSDKIIVKWGPNDPSGFVDAKPNMLGPQTFAVAGTITAVALLGAGLMKKGR